ncbi:Rossmann-like alpha/beta/alpha sandwich fold [Kalmanozyma brasiliensis GHG001]|uniref:DUF218 domain-containing protein n=1 Tax=Kalmanozyma brasiliensis (strain GHG001) TaxID=1365824 RepID=V5GJT0_KALBG|nr:Rossmann-like alpha/beta/alpha sandwich fold [Kalmanozyma brasiliensis GHG001]EST06217.1 Rossmann-like alpha/beta/alpha sandwich fold [Kalmanozyma brasiliensis GHG001]
MVPKPSGSLLSGARKSGIFNGGSGPSSGVSIHDRLSARSRVTNLGVVLLLGFAGFSALLNLRYMLFHRGSSIPQNIIEFGGRTPDSLTASVAPPRTGAEKLNHLVIVTGHAVWAGCDVKGKDNDENWVLEEYQKGGSVKTFYKHIEKGMQLTNEDPNALLVFSGGQTRPNSLQTEAESYYSLALSAELEVPMIAGSLVNLTTGSSSASIGSLAHANAAVATRHGLQDARMTTENYALDSFENLLFSIARFREYTAHYPARITVVGYAFKKARFEDLHAKAVRWNTQGFLHKGERTFQYVGVDDEGLSDSETVAQSRGEKLKAFNLFDKDMYGCHGRLRQKRIERNPTRRFHPYMSSAPEIADLLNWCPAENSGLQGLYPENLPWDARVIGTGWGRGALAVKANSKGNIIPDTRWLQIGREQ